MDLLPKELKKLMPAFDSTSELESGEIPIIAKFFTPDSSWTWYATEGEEEGEDFVFFGLVDGIEREWGYFSLSELTSVTGPMNLPVERDIYFTNKKIKDIE